MCIRDRGMLGGDEANPRIKLLDTFGAAVQALLNGDVDMVTMDASSIKGDVYKRQV